MGRVDGVEDASLTARFSHAVATVVAPLFVFPMILLGGLYANVGAIPVGARWINKVCLRARNFDAPYAIDATRSPHRSTL